VRLNEIAKVGLQLNLDDELSLHCWASDGSVYPLLGKDTLNIRMQDSESDTDAPGPCQEYKWMQMQTPMELKILENCRKLPCRPNILQNLTDLTRGESIHPRPRHRSLPRSELARYLQYLSRHVFRLDGYKSGFERYSCVAHSSPAT
jgi:hypothetical protein